MSSPRYARLASTMLARLGPAAPPTPDPDDRAQAIAAIAGAINVSRRRRRVRRFAVAFGAVAACALTSFGGYRFAVHHAPVEAAPATASVAIVAHPVSGGSSVVVSGAQAPLDDGRLLGAGSRVVTPANGRAMLSFSTGSTVLLREGTDMTLAAEGATQRLELDAGSVELHVAKLAPEHRFIVGTPDSEVEVRGTRFSVAVVASDPGCGGGVRTRVAVTEGVVVVRHAGIEDRVGAGEPWPSGCVRAPATSAIAALGSTSHAPSPVAPSTGSTLADQNDLFAGAAAAKRRGDMRGALAALDRFLATYPTSPLTETVVVERMRVLEQQVGSRGRSVVAAREYLARYPDGFAHAEAEAIVAEEP